MLFCKKQRKIKKSVLKIPIEILSKNSSTSNLYFGFLYILQEPFFFFFKFGNDRTLKRKIQLSKIDFFTH